MALTSKRSKRKVSGGRYIGYRKKRIYEKRRLPVLTKLGNKIKKLKKTMGNKRKEVLFGANEANVFIPQTKKHKVVKIKSVLENKANRHFVRRNIITKGTIVDTELGQAKITSRPGQNGAIDAVLLKKK
ncbi:MAG: 30S ribosomal protein S8e [Nanoarchaeota archaeon]|nr:30S ribosomal protein S8e [Nanoarchaeota archaeon]